MFNNFLLSLLWNASKTIEIYLKDPEQNKQQGENSIKTEVKAENCWIYCVLLCVSSLEVTTSFLVFKNRLCVV